MPWEVLAFRAMSSTRVAWNPRREKTDTPAFSRRVRVARPRALWGASFGFFELLADLLPVEVLAMYGPRLAGQAD